MIHNSDLINVNGDRGVCILDVAYFHQFHYRKKETHLRFFL